MNEAPPTRFRDVAAPMAANGYRPLPIAPGKKYPGFDDWQHFAFTPGCERQYPRHGAGVLLGEVVALDIDVDDPDAASAIENAVREIVGISETAEIPRRIGNAPKVLIPFRTDTPFCKLTSAFYKIKSTGNAGRVEVLAAGQQFVAYHVHPITQRPYSWNGGGDLLSVPLASLPSITETQARAIVAAAETILEEWGERVTEARDDTAHAAVAGATISAGGRNDALTRLAGKLRRNGLSGEAIAAALHIENAARCNPPLLHEEVETIARSVGRYEPAEQRPTPPVKRFPTAIAMAELATAEPPAREWAIDGILPFGASALLSAHGGIGKTLLILTMAVCIALGLPFFGLATQRAVVLLVLAEDDRNEIHRRLRAVCASMNVELAALADGFHIFDAVGCDVALFGRRAATTDDGRTIYTAGPDVTDTYDWLCERIKETGARALFLDSTSDMFDAEENRRPDVRRYLNSVLAPMLPQQGAVVHVAHIDKFAARGGATNAQTFSGSTAWNNSVRTRLALTRATCNDGDDAAEDDGRRILTVEKSNYSRPGLAIPLRYDQERHVFVRDVEEFGIVASIRSRTERRAVLQCLIAAAEAGRSVMVSPRANDNAGVVLSRLPPYPPALRNAKGKKRLFDILLDLEGAGAIDRETFRTASKHDVDRWRVTEAGRTEAGNTP